MHRGVLNTGKLLKWPILFSFSEIGPQNGSSSSHCFSVDITRELQLQKWWSFPRACCEIRRDTSKLEVETCAHKDDPVSGHRLGKLSGGKGLRLTEQRREQVSIRRCQIHYVEEIGNSNVEGKAVFALHRCIQF